MIVVLGIDPGKSGGFAVIGEQFETGAMKTPESERELWERFKAVKISAPGVVAYLESVGASPQMGTVSAFTFGRSFGLLIGMLYALEIPFEFVRPSTWQKALGLTAVGKKFGTKGGHLKEKACQLYPGIKVTNATADALLIATYGYRLRTGTL